MTKIYTVSNGQRIKEQADIFLEEVTSGLFRITKGRVVSLSNQLFSVHDVIHFFNTNRKAALKVSNAIHTNFEFDVENNQPYEFNESDFK